MIEGKGDGLPVSAMPVDGTWPTGTTQYEKRNIGVAHPRLGAGYMHSVRPLLLCLPPRDDQDEGLRRRPAESSACGVQVSRMPRGKELEGLKFTVQVAPEDCTGCGSCVYAARRTKKTRRARRCPGFKAINMSPPGAANGTRRRRTTHSSLACLRQTPPGTTCATSREASSREPLFEYTAPAPGAERHPT